MNLWDWVVAGFGFISGIVLWIILAIVCVLALAGIGRTVYVIVLWRLTKRAELVRKWRGRVKEVEYAWGLLEARVAKEIKEAGWAAGQKERWARMERERAERYSAELRAMPHALLPKGATPGVVHKQNDDGTWSTRPDPRFTQSKKLT